MKFEFIWDLVLGILDFFRMKYIIIDSNAIIHRAFHALPPFTAPDGSPTGAVYGFTSILIKILKDLKPDYVLAAFDTAAPTFRHIAYEKYKAQREKAPDELYAQFPKTKEVLGAFNIPILEKDGFEADDIIGTLAKKIPQEDKTAEIIIVTGDMDTFQLVNKNVSVFTMRRGITDTVLYDERAVRERFGFGPETMIDYKALRGDPSDNIPGVKGIGEKTATELLKKYKKLENIYKLLKKKKLKESASLLEKLKASENEAILSKNLATINTAVTLKISLQNLPHPQTGATPEIKAVLEKFGFRSLLARLTGEKKEVKKEEQKQALPFSAMSPTANLKTADGPQLQKLFQAKQIAIIFDETNGLLLISDGKNVFKTNAKDIARIEKTVLENCQKIIFDAKPLIKEFKKQHGILLENNFFDLKIAGFLLYIDTREITPERLISVYLAEITASQPEELIKKFFQLREILEKKLKEENAWFVFSEIESPLISILSQMENKGIKIDTAHLKKAASFFKKNLDKLTGEIYKEAGEEFNINSPQQLSEILFTKLGVSADNKKIKRTGGGKLSTNQEQLLELQNFHPIIKKIIEYREIAKLKTTYSDTLPELISKDGRIHTTFGQTGTVTGRMSSRDPNLQNVPIKTPLGKEIRRAFVAEKGFIFASFDYSQLELRIAAELAQDLKMIEAFSNGVDIHKLTAAEINNVPLEKVTPEMRRAAKTLNFGILYGMGVKAFARGSGFSESEAKKFFEEYSRDFSGIEAYIEKTIEFAKEKGYVETYYGRRRYLEGLLSGGFRVKKEAERMAINMPIQGTAADMVKLAMISVSNMLKNKYNEKDIRMLLQIHDELLFEIADKKDISESVIKDIKNAMEGVWKGKVLFKVDVKLGKNWADLT
ncbi:MAG: polymerase protein [Parcubacteria group bacterium GW2011_GWA2_42_14]|nr:MAG: polymerase protein [Parcubacteria group bacterium GW2011_GWA2_42_14]